MSEISQLSADELMRQYISVPRREGFAHFLDLLIENHAMPVIEKSLRAKFYEAGRNGFTLAEQDFEDLCNESCLKLVEKLTALRSDPNANEIKDFRAYAAVVAFNSWNEFVNHGTPQRKSLKNKIRYALGKNDGFEIWAENDEIFGGLVTNKRRTFNVSIDELVLRITDECENFRKSNLPDLLFEIFGKAKSGIRLNELVTIVSKLWAVEDLPDVSLDGFVENLFYANGNRRNEFEMRFELEKIWSEIKVLPENQRIALLYNLRDETGGEMLFMFFNTNIATLRDLSVAMNLSPEECAKILPELPLDDKTIGERMNLTAKQVANLRKVARENLQRRIAGKPKRQSRTK